MRALYFDCSMGAAGDMLMAALLELHPDPDCFLERLNNAGIPGVVVRAVPAKKCGITGTQVLVTIQGNGEGHAESRPGHPHRENSSHPAGLPGVQHIIRTLHLPGNVRSDVLAVYDLIAGAESHVHEKPVTLVHFHEVGAMDAIADITGVCLLLKELGPEKVLASPVHVGSGQVRCAHGLLPVPAPATAFLLQGIPSYGGAVEGELCTPTGAALLKHFCSAFIPLPAMNVERTGYGMGKKDFSAANCVRALLGPLTSRGPGG